MAPLKFYSMQVNRDGEWQSLYGFTLEQFRFADFLLGNHYHLSSPLSAFTKQRFVIKASESKRWVLLDRSVREYAVSNASEILSREYIITSAAQMQEELRVNGGIELDAAEAERIFAGEPAMLRQ
jgi:arylamine N-acetyltransferase